MMYTYAYFLFGAAFNGLFLAYVVLFSGSMIALITALWPLDAHSLIHVRSAQTRIRSFQVVWTCGYMAFVAVGLTTVYVLQSVRFITSGQLPQIIRLSGHPTSLVFALDLSLVVPAMLYGTCWLWQARPWGYVLATVVSLKGALYTLSLAIASIVAARNGVPGTLGQLPLWVVLTVAGMIATLSLLGGLEDGVQARRFVETPDEAHPTF